MNAMDTVLSNTITHITSISDNKVSRLPKIVDDLLQTFVNLELIGQEEFNNFESNATYYQMQKTNVLCKEVIRKYSKIKKLSELINTYEIKLLIHIIRNQQSNVGHRFVWPINNSRRTK